MADREERKREKTFLRNRSHVLVAPSVSLVSHSLLLPKDKDSVRRNLRCSKMNLGMGQVIKKSIGEIFVKSTFDVVALFPCDLAFSLQKPRLFLARSACQRWRSAMDCVRALATYTDPFNLSLYIFYDEHSEKTSADEEATYEWLILQVML